MWRVSTPLAIPFVLFLLILYEALRFTTSIYLSFSFSACDLASFFCTIRKSFSSLHTWRLACESLRESELACFFFLGEIGVPSVASGSFAPSLSLWLGLNRYLGKLKCLNTKYSLPMIVWQTTRVITWPSRRAWSGRWCEGTSAYFLSFRTLVFSFQFEKCGKFHLFLSLARSVQSGQLNEPSSMD